MKLAVLAAIAASFAFAQRPDLFRDATTTATTTLTSPTDSVTTYLALTSSQLTGFTAIKTTMQTSAQPILTQLQTKLEALRTALKATPVNTSTVTSIQNEITALRAQLTKIQTDAQTQMKALLTSDQKLKLAALEAAAALQDEIQGASILGLMGAGPGISGPGFGGPGGRRPF
jgi:Spy/CpxP family protein refolding chaperone